MGSAGEMSTRNHAGSVRALARKRQQQRGSAKATVSRLVSTYLISLADRVVNIVGITARPDEACAARRAHSDRCGKRGDAREGVSSSGSGYQVNGSIPAADPGQWDERHPANTTITEPECIRGAICRSIKSECLNRRVFTGQASLRRAVAEYVDHHYHGERNHQGLDNRLIRTMPSSLQEAGTVRRKQRLGGMLNINCREGV
jgi:putative transposase